MGFLHPATEFAWANSHVDVCGQVQVLEGELKCPESERVFPIRKGIPNMLLDEA